MVRSRSRPPPFFPESDEQKRRDHWVTVEDPWQKLLEVKHLPAGTDLLRTFLALLLSYHDDGWVLHEFTSNGAQFYASKNGKKVYVQITCFDPAMPRRPYVHFRP